MARTSARRELLAITGIGLTPTFVWVTAGAQPRLFAYIFRVSCS
jgi:hypothetical protein